MTIKMLCNNISLAAGTCIVMMNRVITLCYVIGANVLGQVNRGAAVLMSGLDLERLILAAGPVGLMQAAVDVAFPYVHERKQFNEPIGTFQVNNYFIAS